MFESFSWKKWKQQKHIKIFIKFFSAGQGDDYKSGCLLDYHYW